jgi:hypothetical protein
LPRHLRARTFPVAREGDDLVVELPDATPGTLPPFADPA